MRALNLVAQCAPVALVATVVAASVFAAVITAAGEPAASVAQGDLVAVACRFAPS
jgi:hypothetical protein